MKNTSKTIVIGYTFQNSPLFWKAFIDQLAEKTEGYDQQLMEERIRIINEELRTKHKCEYVGPIGSDPASLLFKEEKDAILFLLKYS